VQSDHRSILLLGSNLSNRHQHIAAAKKQIAELIGKIEKQSSIYETEPWGVSDQPSYFNAALTVRTPLAPSQLLTILKKIETHEGRVDRKKYAPRTLDIDILFYDDLVLNSKELIIPHPKLHLRKFALVPLAEIEESFIHPILKKSVAELLFECRDTLGVWKVEE